MAEPKFTESDLQELLAEVESDIKNLLKSEEQVLSKAKAEDAEESAPAPAKEASPSDPAPEAVAQDPKDDSAMPPAAEASAEAAPAAPEASASESSSSSSDSSSSSSDSSSSSEGSTADEAGEEVHAESTPDELHDFYTSLDDEDLKLHYLAAKAALFGRMEASPEAPAEMAPEAAAPEAAPAAPEAAPMEPAEKNEMSAEPKKEELSKSEPTEVPVSRAEYEALKKNAEEQIALSNALADTLDKVLRQPVRKSFKGISELNYIPKVEEEKQSPAANLSKSEVTGKLRERMRDPKLSKKDRDLVNDFCFGKVTLEKVEHLLKD